MGSRKPPSNFLTPSRGLAISFGLAILLGTLTLKLPGMSRLPHLSWIDSLFTAASATCVTGLITVDTGSAWTLSGQIVILGLIQLGGLGIMTFSIFFYTIIGRRVSLVEEMTVRETFSHLPQKDVLRLVKSIVLYTLLIEMIGAFCLFLIWTNDYHPLHAFYAAIFHSVSAFCNAGFSLWPDSLTRYRTNIGVNIIFIVLIIAGGLGFVVLSELKGFIQGRRKRTSLHTKIVLLTTGTLIVAGMAFFCLIEWNNVLAGLGLLDKLTVSAFQAVTPRTAGFNSVNYDHLSNATLLITIFLMFVGGSPGSTAGGIKTVTIALLFFLALSRYRGFTQVNAFKRTIPMDIITRSLTIIVVALLVVGLALTFLLFVETGSMDHSTTRDIFLRLTFETVSAFGTVGLSMGATPDLSTTGKIIIIITMFLGRIGPLTAAMALVERGLRKKPYNYATEEVMVG